MIDDNYYDYTVPAEMPLVGWLSTLLWTLMLAFKS